MVQTIVGSLAVRVRGLGPPVVLWHSLFVDERSWGRVESELAVGHHLVLITGPGHGTSSDPGRRYPVEECAEAARTVLDHLGISAPVDWVGNAWGGHVGARFAATWPARCRTLVTIGTLVQALNVRERARTISLLLAYRLLGPAGFIQDGIVDVLLSAKTRAHDPEAVELVKDCIANADRTRLRNAVVSISLQREDLASHLPRISAPTLFITGADHHGWTPQQARTASQLLPQGSSAVVADAAYLVPLEAPGETVQLVRQFWDTQVTRAQTT
ncbi:MAG: alpha/beta hydrolase [Actinomycetota bacterium]|nr:alpha/beta hydrolase [Actinomycetota bacterium]